jgi:hypothetical protein
MSTNAESRGTFAVISPRVERGYRHAEILGEIFNSEQPIGGLHCVIFRWNPLIRVLSECQRHANPASKRPVGAGEATFRQVLGDLDPIPRKPWYVRVLAVSVLPLTL